MFIFSYICTKSSRRIQRNLVMGQIWGLDGAGSFETRVLSMYLFILFDH